MTDAIYYDDLTLGQRFTAAAVPMERERLLSFAAEFDPQPQHLSDALAAGSQFGTLVASGWHTAALTMRMQVEMFFNRVPGGGMGAQVDTLAWRRPVLPGDLLHAVMEVTALRLSRSRPGRGLVTLHTTTFNQRDQAVMEMDAAVLLPLRPDDAVA
jgi:acyl dehydratase